MAPSPGRSVDDRLRAIGQVSPVALHVLLALADRNRHGLGIAEQVQAATDGRVTLGPGTLYGAIKRLLETGLVEDTDAAPDDDRNDPRRRYYRLTPLGRRALTEETAHWAKVLKVARVKRVL
jgi:DNA-binding PadR family transcriptional regulator